MRLIPIFLLFALALGCAKKKEPQVSSEPLKVLEGSMESNVLSIQANRYREDCDEKFKDVQLEIARSLDAKAGEIDRYIRENALVDDKFRSVTMGPTYFVDRINPLAVRAGISLDPDGWKYAAELYAEVKGQPMSKKWVSLNSSARATLLEDVNRVVHGYDPYLGYGDSIHLKLLLSEVEACLAKSDCVALVFSASSQKFIERQPYLKSFTERLPKKETFADKRSYLERFKQRIEGGLERYSFEKNTHMKKIGPNLYELEMDPGPFAGVTTQIKAMVESVWRGSAGQQVSIAWKNQAAFPALFRVELGALAGGRAYVNYRQKVLMMYPGSRVRTLPHEVGHVMGFPDTYYALWRPERCEYDWQVRDEDIMSEVESGTVLPEHWEELSRQYQY